MERPATAAAARRGSGGVRPQRALTTVRHRYRHSAAVCGVGEGAGMWVFGGVDVNHKRFNDLLRFDFRTRRWHEVSRACSEGEEEPAALC